MRCGDEASLFKLMDQRVERRPTDATVGAKHACQDVAQLVAMMRRVHQLAQNEEFQPEVAASFNRHRCHDRETISPSPNLLPLQEIYHHDIIVKLSKEMCVMGRV